MDSSSGRIRREDVVLALGYAALAWLLHSVDITATREPLLPWLAPWWPLLTVAGSAAVVLRRRRTVLMVVVCAGAALALALAGSAGGYFFAFEAVFSLVLFGSARAARTTEISTLAVCAASGAAAWFLTGSLAAGVVFLLTSGMVLLLPAEWAGNLRKAGQLAESESARAAAIRQAARDQASLASREHELALAAERQDMARELHDVLSSRLSAIALQSGAALSSPDGRLSREVLSHVRRESVAGLEELNGMIRMLSTGEPRPLAGNAGDLDAVVDGHRAAGLTIRWTNGLPGGGAGLPGPVQAALYRIVTEALVNAGRHAPGAAVRMSLDQVPAGVRLQVENDGGTSPDSSATGAAASAADRAMGTGTGIPSMLARAEQLGGYACAGPRGSSWAVEAVLPETPLAPAAAAPDRPADGPHLRFPAGTGSMAQGGTKHE
ncbi:sensor histidine kinase [Arthrobacter luteolus]|uniref:sensor histidine kinase n=1 Tax=Arthrobacter luteolus TaxID=98672 RepID=UPI00082A6E17|nr:histidine kinase [Arthrobacter luteolus]